MAMLTQLTTEADLDDRLSAPSEADIAFCRRLGGDVLVLGAAGKMGPSLVQRIVRATAAAGAHHRVIAASRFSSPSARRALEDAGTVAVPVDLLDWASVGAARVPERFVPRRTQVRFDRQLVAHVGHEHDRPGTCRSPVSTLTHRRVFDRQRLSVRARVGARKRGDRFGRTTREYAQSCLGRERVFEYYSREYGTPTLLLRLNYACDLRYGVLVDIARAVKAGRPVDRTVSHFNVIWQGDANSYALRSLEGCASPPRVLNVTGADKLAVTDVAEYFGRRFGVRPAFCGQPSWRGAVERRPCLSRVARRSAGLID